MASFLSERQEVADMCRRFADHGYFAGTGGNIGLRLDGRHFAVTPTATDYETMEAEDVVILRLDTLEQVEGDRKPSVEKGLHQRMLNAYPERSASVHTHQPIASAVALLHETLPWPKGSDLGTLGQPVDHERVQRVGVRDGDVQQEVGRARDHEDADDLR